MLCDPWFILGACCWVYRLWGHQFSSVTQSCPTLCDPMDCSMPGFLDHHQLPELAKTYVCWVGDAIQPPPHPLLSPSSPAFNLSQHQGLFQWVSSSHQVAKVWSFSFSISPSSEYSGMISFKMESLGLQSKWLSRVFSNTQFKSTNSSVLSFLYSPTLTSMHDYWKNHSLNWTDLSW